MIVAKGAFTNESRGPHGELNYMTQVCKHVYSLNGPGSDL